MRVRHDLILQFTNLGSRLLLGATLLAACGAAPAQQRDARRATDRAHQAKQRDARHGQTDRRQSRRRPHTDRKPGASRPTDAGDRAGDARPAWSLPGLNPMRPSSADFGPLTAAEERELMRFARQKLPSLYRTLQNAPPQRRRAIITRAIPRIRQLRRLFDTDPQLARSMLRFIQNNEMLGRARRLWAQHATDASSRQRVENEVRRRIADNVRIEREILRGRVHSLSEERDALVKREVERLAQPEVDLSGEPPAVRTIVDAFRNAPEQDKPSAMGRLRRACGRRVDAEIEHFRQRLRRMNAMPIADVVKQRVAHFFNELRRPRDDSFARPRDDRAPRPDRPRPHP